MNKVIKWLINAAILVGSFTLGWVLASFIGIKCSIGI
jgi:hypothetical protein